MYYIDKVYKDKGALYVMAVDFAKAYDSVKRGTLIKTLMEYMIDPTLTDIVEAGVYTEDSTDIATRDQEINMTITSGVRQQLPLHY